MLRGLLLSAGLGALVAVTLAAAGVRRPEKPPPKVVQLPPKVITTTTNKVKNRTVKVPAQPRQSTPAAPPAEPIYQPVVRPQIVIRKAPNSNPGEPPTCPAGKEARLQSKAGNRWWKCLPDHTRPAAPAGLSATAVDSKVQLTWAAASDRGGIKHYRVYRNGSLLQTTSKTAVIDERVVNGTAYSYRVAAVDRAGNRSRLSRAITATPAPGGGGDGPDTQPPGVPLNLILTADKKTPKVSLRWTAPIDNVGVVSYRIYRDGEQIGTADSTSYEDTAVEHAKEYHYTVQALDAAGNASDKTVKVSTYVS